GHEQVDGGRHAPIQLGVSTRRDAPEGECEDRISGAAIVAPPVSGGATGVDPATLEGRKGGDDPLPLYEATLAGKPKGLGTRGGAELAVDRLGMATDGVVRQVQLAADVALGKRTREGAENRQLALAQRGISVSASRAWRLLDVLEPGGEDS